MTAGDRRPTGDAGFTLVEMLVAVVLSTLVVGVVAAALVTSLNVAASTSEQVADSTDAALISSFLVRDAQSAGATDPATAQNDSTLGVSTDPSAPPWPHCPQPASFLIRFSWIDAAERGRPVVAYYSLDLATRQLTRRLCAEGETVDLVLAHHLTSAVASCDTPCGGTPTTVALDLAGSGRRAPFSYALRASLRRDIQETPTTANSAAVPLVALGARASAPPCRNLALEGPAIVRGSAFVAASCPSTAPIEGDQALLNFGGLGATTVVPELGDPYAGRTPPPATCSPDAPNPEPIGASASRDAVVVYHQPVTITVDTAFQPGRHVFCGGLHLAGGSTTGTDVLLYVAGGTVALDPLAAADLTGRQHGVDTNLLLWVASGGDAVDLVGGPRVANLRGVVYAPDATVRLTSANATNVGGVVARDVAITGPGPARLGLPLPVMTMEPALPGGQVGVAYTVPLTAAGGIAPYTWTAVGLPEGLAMAPDGVVSGIPTTAGAAAVIVTVTDATGQAASFDAVVDVNAAVTATWPALPDGQVGLPYPETPMNASLGTPPYVWSASGLPPGLTIDPATGVLSGTPTAAADPATIVVTVTDALGSTASNTYTVVIDAALGATWPTTMPAAQVGVAFPRTVLTATAGTAPYVWTATGLPPGLTLDRASGAITGTPSVPGTYDVAVTVTDALGATITQRSTIVVSPPFSASWPLLPGGQVGVPYATTPATPTGGRPPYTWSASGLPPGLAIGSATGTITGTPTAAGTFAVTITGVDAVGAWVSNRYDVTIVPAAATCPAAIAGWRGEYFVGTTLSGPPVLCRGDAAIDFDWGNGSPAPNVPVDDFSVRWTRTEQFSAGTYTFTMGSDDGSRLYVDDTLVLDNWGEHGYPGNRTAAVVDLTQGAHTIRMEYFERGGSARATLAWTRSGGRSCNVPATGWLGEYFNNITLTGPPVACRDDAAVNFDWGRDAPIAGVPSDGFSVRWTRTQTFAAGTYDIALGTDDGGRVFVDGVLVLDRWFDQSYPTPPPSVTRTLSAGPHTIVVEHYERAGDARATLTITPISPPPPPSLSFSGLTNASWSGSGTTVYYRSTAPTGSFTVTAASADPANPAVRYGFPTLGARWTSTPGGTGVTTYSWSTSPAAPGTVRVTASNAAGLTSAGAPFTLVDDITPPTAGSVTYSGGVTSSGTVAVAFTTGTDTGSGIGSRLLQRQQAALTGTTCGPFGEFATLPNGTNPAASPVVDAVAEGSCYRYRYVVSDNVGNVTTALGTNVVQARRSYATTVRDTPGLVGYWRLGEAMPAPTTILTDPFGGTPGSPLQSRNATWTRHPISSTDAVFTAGGRLRKGGILTNGTLATSATTPPSADYLVQADVFVASVVPNDLAGVVGRVDPARGTFYAGVYDRFLQRWVLYRFENSIRTVVAQSEVTSLAAGSTYQVALEMTGSTIELSVDGARVAAAFDTAISAPGRAGVMLGYGGLFGLAPTFITDSTGMHLDDVVVRSIPAPPPTLDSRGTNHGSYVNGPTLSVPGALPGDPDTAMTVEGTGEHATVPRPVGGDLSVELWFRSAGGGVTDGPQWWQAAGLVDASVPGLANDFGVGLRADGRVVAGVGWPDSTIASPAAYDDGAWHHVVFTRARLTGLMRLYVDGAPVASGLGIGLGSVLDGSPTLTFGRSQAGGHFFTGTLDEVAVYDTVLSPATVADHYRTGS